MDDESQTKTFHQTLLMALKKFFRIEKTSDRSLKHDALRLSQSLVAKILTTATTLLIFFSLNIDVKFMLGVIFF